jgi:hypothetical protein
MFPWLAGHNSPQNEVSGRTGWPRTNPKHNPYLPQRQYRKPLARSYKISCIEETRIYKKLIHNYSMNIHNKDLLGTIIITVFAGLGLAGMARYFWNMWFNYEKLRQEAKKEFQKQSWQSSEFKEWQLKFVQGKTWLWYGRILSSIVILFLSSLLIIGLVFLFASITKDL